MESRLVAGKRRVYHPVDSAVLCDILFARLDLAQPRVDKDRCQRGSPVCVVRSEVRRIRDNRCRCVYFPLWLILGYSEYYSCSSLQMSKNGIEYCLQSGTLSGVAPLLSTIRAKLCKATRTIVDRLSGLSASQYSSLVVGARTLVRGLPIVLQNASGCLNWIAH